MNTTVALVLNYRRAKADGTYAVLLRITHHRVSTQISTGVFIPEKDWDNQKRLVKGTYKGTESVTRLNNMLQKKKTEANDILTKLHEQKTLDTFTVFELKDMIDKKSDKLSFLGYGEKQIEELLKANRIGTARSYKIVIGVLRTFNNDKDFSFQELNYAFLKKFESAHLEKGNTLNGLAAYVRMIKAIYNKAIKDGLVEKELYPFDAFHVKLSKTRKRAIGLDAIKKIVDLKLKPDNNLFDARNYFLASFYMRGMPFADMAQLKLSNIIDGRIYYQRQKTDKPYNIKITDEIQEIFKIYTKGKTKNDFIFPIIKRTELIEQYKDVEWARKCFNKKLKLIAQDCGIDENLTSYVSRHSFATRAKNLGVPIATISDMLGHADTKTTEVYLDSLQNDILDEAHERIIK
jgi:site-specific recombinase XerD